MGTKNRKHNAKTDVMKSFKNLKPLTKKYAIENKFTPIDCVKYFKPKITKDEADFILWEQTCFPFSTEKMIEQLNNKFLNVS